MKRIGIIASALAAAFVTASCLGPISQPCPSGAQCPPGYKCTASGESCIPVEALCGDGVRDPSEVCDDGNIKDTDGCSKNCQSTEICGNTIIDVAVGELCDDGNTNSGDGCRGDCLNREGCTDGLPDLGEECDDGNLSNEDNCPNTCRIATCGDGFINDAGHREQCDDIGESSACNVNCMWSRCGDFIVNGTASEECDQGAINTNTCNHNCRVPLCGDGLWNHDAGEACDTAGNTSVCDIDCTRPFCPDGLWNPDAGEECDTAGNSPSCNSNCKSARCGDGFFNPDAGEACDTGGNSATCDLDCSAVVCGDLLVNTVAGETCDDTTRGVVTCPYGTQTCTACNDSCTGTLTRRGPYCGDGDAGVDGGVDFGHGELCDDGNAVDEAACPYGMQTCATCSSTCSGGLALTGPYCGDLTVNGPESCDDATRGKTVCAYNDQTCPACNQTCTGTITLRGPYCGDGDAGVDGGVDYGYGELCDDGNAVDETACPYGMQTCATCNSTCSGGLALTGPYCGDEDINGPESCDDDTRNMTACPYETRTCPVCNQTCTGMTTIRGPYCGDGDAGVNGGVDTGDGEICDDGNNTDETACPYGPGTCYLCNFNCSNYLPLTGPYCGDGIENGSEPCDDNNALACGTCNATCTQFRNGPATGTISAVSSGEIVDGEVFILNDGFTTVIYEFDKTGGVASGRIGIPVANNQSGRQMAMTIVDRINNFSAIGITATVRANARTFDLRNVQQGSAGNIAITETVADTDFTFTGMSGGGGFDCPAGTGCATDQDCASPLTCAGPAGSTTCQ